MIMTVLSMVSITGDTIIVAITDGIIKEAMTFIDLIKEVLVT